MKNVLVVSMSSLLLALASCKSSDLEPRTEVLLQIDAERLVKLSADHLTVEISSGPNSETLIAAEPEAFDLTDEEFNWPASIALVAMPGHEDYIFDVSIYIETKGQGAARSRVKSSFIQHQTLLLKTLLYGECLAYLDCSASQTCVAPDGKPRCDDAQVDATSLPKFSPAGASGQTAASGGEGGERGGSAGVAALSGRGGRSGAGQNAAGAGGQSGGQDGGTQDADMPGDGAPGNCQPGSTEQCDNGMDDDCNGQIDCADSACSVGTQCVPSSTLVGALMPATSSCPAGYDLAEQLVHRGLNDPGCGGCSCQAQSTLCNPQAYFYSTSTECAADVTFSGGSLVMAGIPQKPECGAGPIGASIGMNTPAGWRVSVTQSADSCRPSGTATPLPPTWTTSMKLCVRAAERNGCEEGYACVPRVTTGQVCTQRQGASCPAATSSQTWQLDYNDERSCSSCSCAARGGSCSSILVSLVRNSGSVGTAGAAAAGGGGSSAGSGGISGTSGGSAGVAGTTSDCSIVDSSLHDGEKACFLTTFSPGAYWEGTPANPTCTTSTTSSGSLTPSSPLELCCAD